MLSLSDESQPLREVIALPLMCKGGSVPNLGRNGTVKHSPYYRTGGCDPTRASSPCGLSIPRQTDPLQRIAAPELAAAQLAASTATDNFSDVTLIGTLPEHRTSTTTVNRSLYRTLPRTPRSRNK
jgi:hypothetical protein